MTRVLVLVFHKAIGWISQRVVRNVVVPGIVTLVVTAGFSGQSTRSDHVPRVAAAPNNVGIAEWARVSFDPSIVPVTEPFKLKHAPSHTRRAAVAKTTRTASSPPRPNLADGQLADIAFETTVQSAPASTSVAPRSPPSADQTAMADEHRFRVLGIAPVDLVPSPARMMNRMTAIGGSIVGMANPFR